MVRPTPQKASRVALNPRFGLRLLQADYLTLLPNGVNSRQNKFNLTTGILIRFGGKSANKLLSTARSGGWNAAPGCHARSYVEAVNSAACPGNLRIILIESLVYDSGWASSKTVQIQWRKRAAAEPCRHLD
jgi:hypothetical protein